MQLESLQLESLHRRTPCRLNPAWLLVACLALAPLAVHAQDSAADAAALELYDNTVVAEVRPDDATSAAAHIARTATAVRTERPNAEEVAAAVLELATR